MSSAFNVYSLGLDIVQKSLWVSSHFAIENYTQRLVIVQKSLWVSRYFDT